MPTVDGKYVAPTWVDDGPPALDDTELQAMSDGIELLDSMAGIEVYCETFVESATVTMIYNGKTTTATADSSGVATFYPTAYGTYAFTTENVVQIVEIESVEVYYVRMVGALEDTGWDVISLVSNGGNASSVWSIGETKSFTMNSTNYFAQIIDFYHDDLWSGGKAGITFQMKNCYGTTYYMNSSRTNAGGWESCYMRSTVMVNLLSTCPSDLQQVIRLVYKKTYAGSESATINTTTDSLWLLAEVEVFGTISYGVAGEGTQYEYYAAGNSKIKTAGGLATAWWLRSPTVSNTSAFCGVGSGGTVASGYASSSAGVAFGFCV